MEKFDISLLAVGAICSVLLFFLAGYAEKALSTTWKLLYVLPVIICMVIAAFGGLEISLIFAYIGMLALTVGFFIEKKNVRRLVSAISAAGVAASLVMCLTYKGYRSVNYVKDFNKGFDNIKKYYILTEHKNIDFDALYDKYLPEFEAANDAHDELANNIAWGKFCAEFNDAHVGYSPNSGSVYEDVMKKTCGNDYGLSMIRLSDGRIAAVNIAEDSDASKAGIHSGTIITAWDGTDPQSAAETAEVLKIMPFPDIDNEIFYTPIYGAGVGGSTVSVTFIDDNGSEKTAELSKMGEYADRCQETLDTFDGGLNIGNMTLTEVDDTTVALRIKSMQFDTAGEKEEYASLKKDLREAVLEYRTKGYTDLIIDIRGNGGGSGILVRSLAELFAPEGEHYYSTDGVWDAINECFVKDRATGKFVGGTKNYFEGEDLMNGGKIVILVNGNSVSAADHMTRVFGKFDNVTVMGYTKPTGSGQGICGINLEGGALVYSGSLMLDENGDVFIDSDASRKTPDIDITVPVTEEVITAVFDNGEDYLLNKALEYING